MEMGCRAQISCLRLRDYDKFKLLFSRLHLCARFSPRHFRIESEPVFEFQNFREDNSRMKSSSSQYFARLRSWLLLLAGLLPLLAFFVIARAQPKPAASPAPTTGTKPSTAPPATPAAKPAAVTAVKPPVAKPPSTPAPSAPVTPAPTTTVSVPSTPPVPASVGATVNARLQTDVMALTKFPSRVPGTPGNIAAAQYVAARFKQIGLQNVKADEYQVTVPVTKSASLQVGGKNLKVLPIYPNHVATATTPKDGISGPLIYAGIGEPKNYNGQKIEGSIIVLDFNSGQNWITAADLGARAIIFLEPQSTLRGEAERKFASLPVEIPRYYAPRATATALLSVGEYVKTPGISTPPASVEPTARKIGDGVLKSRVIWERVKTSNVVGWIKGSDAELATIPKDAKAPKGDVVVLNAYYDSMSVTPDLAPGAEAAANCAALMELAKHFVEKKPKYSVLVVANGAHHIALAGFRNFAAKYFLDDGEDDKKDDIGRYRAIVGLDLTSRTDTVGIFAKSWFYNQMGNQESILLNQFAGYVKKVNERADTLATSRKTPVDEFYVDGVTGRNGRNWKSYLPAPIAFDSEAATMAQKPGLSFATANDARTSQDTPFDTPDKLNLTNIANQVETISTLLGDMTDIAELPDGSTFSANFGYATARAITRGDIKEKMSFVPDTPISDEALPHQELLSRKRREGLQGTQAIAYILDRNLSQTSYAGVRGAFIERASFSKGVTKISTSEEPGEQGKTLIATQPSAQFMFIGPRVGDPKGGGTPDLEVEAYSLDANGHIIFAPDMGSERSRFTPKFKTANAQVKWRDKDNGEYESNASIMCFECRAVPIFDTLDQRYFSVLKEMSVLDASTDATPIEYGFLAPGAPAGAADIDPVGIMFGRRKARFKLIMAQGLLGKRLVILNTSPATDPKTGEPTSAIFDEGAGTEVPERDAPFVPIIHAAYQTANDLWTLDQQRIRLLKKFGINNQRVDVLHGEVGCPPGDTKKGEPEYKCPTERIARPTGGALLAARTALADYKYDLFYLQARRAFGLESRAYPDVEATSQDVLKGIIFYLALLLPFSYFLERLLFGFPDIRKQIMGTSVMFLIVFTCIRFVHPAFELALTPFIILLAFIILALTVVVTMFLSSKFEQEIKRLKQGVHFADVGRLSAISAALGLGIANMRRRPTRTALTCVTLVLLTFTVLSFTSVTANITNFARPYGDQKNPPGYAGLMVRKADWSPMEDAAVTSMNNEFGQRFGKVARRAWYLSSTQGEQLYLRVANADNQAKFFHAPALVGLTPEEATVGSPIAKTLVAGTWFDGTRRDVCIIPRWILLPKAERQAQSSETDGTASTPAATPTPKKDDKGAETSTSPEDEEGPLLGLTEQDALNKKIQVAGQQFTIIGVFDNQKFRAARDLDGEELTPVDYTNEQNKQNQQSNQQSGQKGQEVSVQSYQHMDANALLLIPYDTAVMLGATTRSVAAGFSDTAKPDDELKDLMNRAALGIFGSTKNKSGVLESRLYSSVESTSYEGFASLLIPITIAALIIANTMLGSVFERTREIGIYSAVGLAPIHVAALFIAEAAVYAVLGSISGYLVAQVVAKIITANNLLQGITLNYSSGSAVVSTLIVMATVLLSTLYPAWAAGKMSQPDTERRWSMSDPIGDIWRFQFPFTVSGQQPLGVAQFLSEFFQAHTDTSVGKFYTDAVHYRALPLHEAVDLLNAGLEEASTLEAIGAKNGKPKKRDKKAGKADAKATDAKATVPPNQVDLDNQGVIREAPDALSGGQAPVGSMRLKLEEIAADPNAEVYHIAMRTWLAPFDMGVSQDTDIVLLPSKEPGLYELQLRLARQSGEIAAWKRTNRGFISDLRKQLLLWRTIKPADQREYVLRGRAHVEGRDVPVEKPDAELTAV
jgi:hypothetical protein